MNGLRKAALYLHGLEEVDREWLLNALTEEERQRLQTTLAELDEMGIPKGDAWLPELAETPVFDGRDSGDNKQLSMIKEIERAELASVTEILDAEPDEIVASLLRHRVWSWRQAYVGKQYLQKRERLLQALERPGRELKPKLENALLNGLAMGLCELESSSEKRFDVILSDAQQSEHGPAERPKRRWLWQR
jgi:hypothetical protein